jgi:hypothetical protein
MTRSQNAWRGWMRFESQLWRLHAEKARASRCATLQWHHTELAFNHLLTALRYREMSHGNFGHEPEPSRSHVWFSGDDTQGKAVEHFQ